MTHHGHLIVVGRLGFVKHQHGADPLGNGFGVQHPHLAVLGQGNGLLGSHNNVFIVGQHKHRLGGGGHNGVQNIVGGGVHGLSAADNCVGANVGKQFL